MGSDLFERMFAEFARPGCELCPKAATNGRRLHISFGPGTADKSYVKRTCQRYLSYSEAEASECKLSQRKSNRRLNIRTLINRFALNRCSGVFRGGNIRSKEVAGASFRSLLAYLMCKSLHMRGSVSCANVLDFRFEHFRPGSSCGNGSKSVFWQRADKTRPRTDAAIIAGCH
jgi:hypothetical protein